MGLSSKKQASKKRTERDEDEVTSNVKTQPQESRSSSDDSSSEDDDDDETEATLFRPASSAQNDESESDNDDDSEEEEEEIQAVKEEKSVQETKAKQSTKQDKKKIKKEQEPAVNTELEEEVSKKTEATVYVEGIPYKADESDVVSHFAPCGIVKEVRMPRYQDSGKPRGYAHVVFEDEKAVSKALKLDGKYLFGRYLTVKVAETPRMVAMALQEQKNVKKPVKGCRTVFIKQLPYEVEEQTIHDALSSCGTITSVRLPLWNHTKKLKGFGYVEFATEEQAVAAVKRSGMKIGDRMVIINLDVAGGGPKASFRTLDGKYWMKGEEGKKALARKLGEKPKKPNAQPQQSYKKRKTM